ncbi:ABC transporter ATP-binding protein [Pseudonocardia kunmingensis]|uniref:Peptide/nickel transport system ATP-binding protein n=1 Tax=Pseudonocardia kunmingensis TaxID=630975 RepID=A0A543DRJ4_9PSEU|nr:ABC transporter ATP-binding protein [Pseudonocardia kunmingensis]TQM11941.1 peptide/nickel transport system ATP-binding protein [Pseudonocardia kunmingensis]
MSTLEEPVADASATSAAPLLVGEDVRTHFRSPRGTVRAVDGISFSLAEGRTLGIVGESGSGKSVLARSIMNILPRRAVVAADGHIRFKGRDVRPLPRAEMRKLWGREMAIVFQDPMTSLNPVLRVGDQLTEPLRVRLGMNRTHAAERALQLFRAVGIPAPERRLREYPHQLSGGMRQRVTIAIALACEPELLLADEPTTALDVTVQRQILDLLAERRREQRMATILVTHDFGVVAGRVDETIVMYAGRAVERAPTALLFTETRHPYTSALIRSIPRLRNPPHTRLEAISGRPPDLVAPPAGCRFAPRCRHAQPRCTTEDPPLTPAGATGHEFACFFPVGTDRGADALARNLRAGRTATGLAVAGGGTGVDT